MTQVKKMKAVKKGRKPVADPKKQISIYVPQSKISQHGGVDQVKFKIYDYLKVIGLLLICALSDNFFNF